MFYTRNSLKQQNSYETTLNIQSELALYFTISRSESIFLIYSNKNCFKALCIERFPKYVFHNNWILFIPLQWVQSRSQSMPVRGLCSGMTLGKSNRNRYLIGCRDHQRCRHINACFLRELRGNIREERIINVYLIWNAKSNNINRRI